MANVKEHPTLMKAEMVRAIFANLKRQTRRVMTYRNTLVDGSRWPKDKFACLDLDNAWVDPGPSPAGNPGPYLKAEYLDGEGTIHRLYPQWQVDDLLWVRETCVIMKGDTMHHKTLEDALTKGPSKDLVFYPATDRIYKGEKRTPSIYMPRWACRLTLPVKAVRPERVQDINREDAIAEGVGTPEGLPEAFADWEIQGVFGELWDSINAKRGYGWKENPWVWVIQFERIDDATKT